MATDKNKYIIKIKLKKVRIEVLCGFRAAAGGAATLLHTYNRV